MSGSICTSVWAAGKLGVLRLPRPACLSLCAGLGYWLEPPSGCRDGVWTLSQVDPHIWRPHIWVSQAYTLALLLTFWVQHLPLLCLQFFLC